MKNTVTNRNGYELNFEAAVQFMDDELREELHMKLAPCTEQEFFTEYEEAHGRKYGVPWFLSESNPQW